MKENIEAEAEVDTHILINFARLFLSWNECETQRNPICVCLSTCIQAEKKNIPALHIYDCMYLDKYACAASWLCISVEIDRSYVFLWRLISPLKDLVKANPNSLQTSKRNRSWV